MTIESPKSRNTSNEAIKEIPEVDVLAIIGHSIEEDATRGFVPTRLIQKLDENKRRTGVRERGLSPDDDSAYVGGGNAVALAAAEMYDVLIERGTPPKAVSVVPGRPLYLEHTSSDINEGTVMLEAFTRRAKQQPENVVTLGMAKNTAGELEEHLKMCVERSYKSIGFVLLELRIERAEALLDKLKREHTEFSSLETYLVSAETLLRHRYRDNPNRLRELEKISTAFTKSQAHIKTVVDEKGGAEATKRHLQRQRELLGKRKVDTQVFKSFLAPSHGRQFFW